jgi:hypothetical protein
VSVPGGVIFSHNSFSGNWNNDFLQIKDAPNVSNGWAYDDTLGARDADNVLGLSTSFTGYRNLYIEDNTFYGGANQGIDCDDNCRMVNRHNSFLDSESNSHGKDTSAYGMRHFEIYSNNFKNTGAETGDRNQIANESQAIWIRGGTGVIYNNTFDNLAGQYWGTKTIVNMGIRSDLWNCTSPPSYPVSHQLGQNHNRTSDFTDPIFLWNNTWNPGQGSGNIRVNAGYGWGNGCSRSFSTYFQWGRDGVDNGTANTPKAGYTPYTYPHPLVAGPG